MVMDLPSRKGHENNGQDTITAGGVSLNYIVYSRAERYGTFVVLFEFRILFGSHKI